MMFSPLHVRGFHWKTYYSQKSFLIKPGALFLNWLEVRMWTSRSEGEGGAWETSDPWRYRRQSWKILDIALALWWCCHRRSTRNSQRWLSPLICPALEASWKSSHPSRLKTRSKERGQRRCRMHNCWKISRNTQKGVIPSFLTPPGGNKQLLSAYLLNKTT